MEKQKKLSTQLIAGALAVTGIFMFSSKAVMVKLAYEYGVDSVTLLLLRMCFSLPIFLIIGVVNNLKNPQQERVGNKILLQLVLMGFVGYYLASYFDFSGLTYVSASLERLILFVYPTLVVLISYIFLKKPILKQQRWAIGLTYFGMLIVFSNLFLEEQKGTTMTILWGSFLVFLSALTYAIYLIGSGEIIPKIGTVRFTTYAMLVSCCCVIIHYLMTNNDYTIVFQQKLEVYGLGLMMAVFATVIPSYLISEAIRRIGASTVSILGSLGPISTIGLSMVFLEEILTCNQIIGAVFVIIGVLLVSKKKA